MTAQSSTPRTDALIASQVTQSAQWNSSGAQIITAQALCDLQNHARQLERELAAAQAPVGADVELYATCLESLAEWGEGKCDTSSQDLDEAATLLRTLARQNAERIAAHNHTAARLAEEINLKVDERRRAEAAESALAEAKRNARRYEWLCDDLPADQRFTRSHLFNRMSLMGKGAIDAFIDAAIDAALDAKPTQRGKE